MKAGERRARAIIDALLAAPEGMTQTPLMESIGLVPEGASRAARRKQNAAFRSAITMAGEHVPALYEDEGTAYRGRPAALYRICPNEWAVSGWCEITTWNRASAVDEDDGCYLPTARVTRRDGRLMVAV